MPRMRSAGTSRRLGQVAAPQGHGWAGLGFHPRVLGGDAELPLSAKHSSIIQRR
jgi:hypothetical protein